MNRWIALLCVPVVFWMASPAFGGRQTFVLRDHLNVAWQRELVSFPLEAGKGECHRDSLTLKGPTGAVPVQLSRTTFWPGEERFVKSAKVWFIVDLAPLETREYTLDYGPKPLAGKALKTDLEIKKQDKGLVELSTSRFGIKLLVGRRTFTPAASPEQAPGPVESMRLSNGTWFGGSHLYGKTKIKRYWARLTAEGPIFAEVTFRYVYADGNAFTLVAQLAAGDSAVLWDLDVKKDSPEEGWRLILSRGLPPLILAVRNEFDYWPPRNVPGITVGAPRDLPLDTHRKDLVTQLSPWHDWWNTWTQTTVRLKIKTVGTELQLISRDAGAWVVPAKPGTMRIWSAWHHKLLALKRSKDGEVCLNVNLAAGPAGGVRKWSVGEGQAPAYAELDMTGRNLGRLQVPRRDRAAVGRRLDVVKDYVLDWPRKPGARHPRLFFSEEDVLEHRKRTEPNPRLLLFSKLLARPRKDRRQPDNWDMRVVQVLLGIGDLETAKKGKWAERLKHGLNLFGEFDVMRSTVTLASLYDAMIDSELITDAERPALRAQMVYLGYRLRDPFVWSIERGYRSYNPNMSVSYVLNLGMIACLFPDHPKAAEWAKPAIDRMRIWMAKDVGPKGTWPESTHYAHVSASVLLSFAVAAKRAGFHDFFQEGTIKRLMLYLAKTYTPPDPLRGNLRVTAPFGRSNGGNRFGLVGAIAKATAKSDPEYSRIMQWAWKEGGYSTGMCTANFGGQQRVYLDKRLPAQAPDWISEHFPNSMTILRHGVGTPYEHYINLLTNSRVLFAKPAEPGSLMKVYFKGKPVGGALEEGTHHRQELLMSRVLPARSLKNAAKIGKLSLGHNNESKVSAFAAQPRLDYLAVDVRILKPVKRVTDRLMTLPDWPPVQREGKPPIQWRRQVLFIKDDDPAKANYLLLRDTVSGGQPTMWQFWTLSEKIGTPDQTKDLDAFLADKPGTKNMPYRELRGDRFTAVGQFDVDLEYYIAAPKGTPRYTLRYGMKFKWPPPTPKQYQDLLNLRLSGDGHYFVVLYPRLRDEPAPTFTTLAGGTVIQVEGRFGRDYGFLSATETEAQTDRFRFKGKAGCIQERGGEVVLALGARGEIRYDDITLAAEGAVSVRRHKGRIRVSLPADHAGTNVRLKLPGRYTWEADRLAGRSTSAGVCSFSVPAGVSEIDLVAK